MEYGGFLGMGTDRYPLPWNTLKYDTALDGYVVPLDKATLEGGPRYPVSDRPVYTNDFGGKVDDYYGAPLLQVCRHCVVAALVECG